MRIKDTFKEVETTVKPIPRKLQEGRDFQILGEAFGHKTISIELGDGNKILMCKGNNLLLTGISFKKGMVLEKHTTSLPARLVVLEGEIEYSTSLGNKRLKNRDEHQILVDEPHWVEAIVDSLIILIKNP